jgi:hypothetical protein
MTGMMLKKKMKLLMKKGIAKKCNEVQAELLIKLLTRCKKMYQAKGVMEKLIKMIVQREEMLKICLQTS